MGSEGEHSTPPEGADFWTLMDHFWVLGIGNKPHADGTPQPWTAEKLELAFDGSPDKRSIENWRSRANKPSPDNIRKLSWAIAPDNDRLRRAWFEALVAARQAQIRSERSTAQGASEPKQRVRNKPWWLRLAVGSIAALAVVATAWWVFKPATAPLVENIRICDRVFFDQEIKKCTKHVSVFFEGIDEVYLSFDFAEQTFGMPFERIWVLNGERVAGRTSFNDEAWPGYTFWRPGVLNVGQYVVRIVMDEKPFTQTFQVQQEGYVSDL